MSIPKKVVPVIDGKTYPKENVISVTPEQERIIASMLGHQGRVGKAGIKHFPPVSNSDAGVAETKASGGKTTGNSGSTTGSKMGSSSSQTGGGGPNSTGGASGGQGSQGSNGGGTQNASREAQGNVQGTPSKDNVQGTQSRSPQGNINSQPATQKMAGSTQSGIVDRALASINKTKTTTAPPDDGIKPQLNNRNPLPGNAPGSPNAYENTVQKLAEDATKAKLAGERAIQQSQYRSPPSVQPGVSRPGTTPVTSGPGKTSLPTPALARDDRMPTTIAPSALDKANPFADVFGKTPLDPSMQGRFEQTSPWDNGVPDLPGNTTVYKTPATPPAAVSQLTAQTLNNMIHRTQRVPTAYNDVEIDTPAALKYDETGQPTTPRTTEPNGYTPPETNIPVPRQKPTSIGEALQSLANVPVPRQKPAVPVDQSAVQRHLTLGKPIAPAPAKMQDRAYPDSPIENAAIPGQIGTILSKNFTPQTSVPENLFDNLTGAPPDRAVLNPKFFDVKAPEALEPAYRPPSTFAAPKPEVQAQLHDLISKMIQAKQNPEKEVGTPAPSNGPATRSVTPQVKPTTPAATPPASNALTDLGKLIQSKVQTGMDTFKDAAEKIEAIGGPEVVTGLSKFVQSLSGKGAPTGPGGGDRRGGHQSGGGSGRKPKGGDTGSGETPGTEVKPNPADWEGKGFTEAEIKNLKKLKGEAYTKELARLNAIYNPPPPPGPNQNLLAEYLAKQLQILSGSGNGLISI